MNALLDELSASTPNICQTHLSIETIHYAPDEIQCDRCGQPAHRVWNTRRVALDLAV